MRLRIQIFLILLLFGLAPLVAAVIINFPLILDRLNQRESAYHDAYRKFLHAEFHDLNLHLFSRNDMVRLLAKMPEPGFLLKSDHRPGESSGISGRSPAAVQPVPRVGSRSLQAARMRYTTWINEILRDQVDIVQILFLDKEKKERFWLERNPKTLRFESTGRPNDRPTSAFLEAAERLNPGGFLVSKIDVDPGATDTDPGYAMVLRLTSPIVSYGRRGNESLLGSVVISIDVGQLSKSFRDTYWVHSDGHYLSVADGATASRTAFDDFPGLERIFDVPGGVSEKPEPEVWKGGDGKRVIWVPWFLTEQSGVLWVGRQMGLSPVTDILRVLPMRVIAIVLSLIVAVLIVAHWVAGRTERFRRELTDGIRRVLAYSEPVRFSWRGPQELRELGENLTRLTERHAQNTEALQAHSRELEESNRYKSEFLANVSHELRTPLNSIILLSKMLAENADNQLSADHSKQSRVIYTAAKDLRDLIDGILDLSRIDARQVALTPEPIDLPRLLAGLVELVEPQIEEKGLDIRVEFEEDVPADPVSDDEKVRQILKNFLSNAIKFTTEGQITLIVARNTDEDGSQRPIRISVRDTGIGIPGEKQDVIFEAFQQADGSTSRRYGGTGLGLTISRKLAQLLGGRIHLASEVGKGSMFSLLLPVSQHHGGQTRDVITYPPDDVDKGSDDDRASVEDRAPVEGEASVEYVTRDETDKDFSGKSLLIVDNDIHALLALAPRLEHWGLRVVAAFDAEESLDALSEDGPFDLVLINLDLPEKEGYETIFRIRGQEPFRSIPIVALAVEYDPEDQERCLATGAVECLGKPVEPLELKRVLARLLYF